MNIGNFTQNGDGYTGHLRSVGLTLAEVTISPVTAKQGNGPDFAVLGKYALRHDAFELGAAWARTSKEGKAYLSVKLDGPTLAAPIYCALIRQQDGSFALIWNRDSRREEAVTA